MTDLDAIMQIEAGDEDGDDRAAWQQLLDSGTVWHLQGFYGRTAEQMIAAGYIVPKGVPAGSQHPGGKL